MKNKFFFFVVSFLLVFAMISCVNGLGNSSSSSSGGSSIPSNSSSSSSSMSSSSVEEVEVDFSELTYIAYGDSITHGAKPITLSIMSDPYCKLVAQNLGLKSYKIKAGGGACFAKYKGFDCISEYVQNNTEAYDIISVMGGTNDCGKGVPLGTIDDTTNATVYGALNIIATTLQERNPDSFIFFMTPYVTYKHLNGGYNLLPYVQAVRDVGAKYDIPVLDMYLYGGFEDECLTEVSDGVHPTQEFVRTKTAPQIAEFIRKNYK